MEAKMSKFEIKLTDDELDSVLFGIQGFVFPDKISKESMAFFVFTEMTSWNIRKVREAVSRLQAKGLPIIAHHGGYSVFGDDPQPVIEYLNREYHRVYEETKKNDQIFHALKQKYGDAVSEKVQQIPGQPTLGGVIDPSIVYLVGQENVNSASSSPVRTLISRNEAQSEPPFRKSIDARGNEKALDFEYDA
jgi:hypothetical protein